MLNDVINQLISEGLVRKNKTNNKTSMKQLEHFTRLLNKATNNEDAIIKYLSLYDSLFRLFEYKLSKFSLVLTGKSPHKALKNILPLFYAKTFKINDINLIKLVETRHKAKKEGIVPCEKDLADLKKLIEEISKIEGIYV